MPFSKFHPLTRVLMWTYVNLWVLTPDKCPFFLQNTRLFCIFVVRLINPINQLCLSLIITIKTQINRRPSVAWSSPRVTFPSFCLALPGKSSRDSYAKIQTSQASLSSVDERFFPQKSTLFTNIWGTHRVPRFRGLERVLRALKHARTLWRVNLWFVTGKLRLYDGQNSGL